MPALTTPSPILYVSSESSFFSIFDEKDKKLSLKDVTRIDFPLIEKGLISEENFSHALKSLEQQEIHLIVSDEVFYHHISDYSLGNKSDIDEEIKETVATVFSDKKEPLHIVTVDLAKTSKMQTVQITAMTKENLRTLSRAAKEAEVKILSIIPASFVVKAFVSVDPSLFLLSTAKTYLLTSHYIGVDFAQNIEKDQADALPDTIKKLKKERPHIQHIYICADKDDTNQISKTLDEILPIQAVEVPEVSCDSDTPFFLRALSVGIREVIENDFPLPHFSTHAADTQSDAVHEDAKLDKKKGEEAKVESKIVEPIAEILKQVKAESQQENSEPQKAAIEEVDVTEHADETKTESEKQPDEAEKEEMKSSKLEQPATTAHEASVTPLIKPVSAIEPKVVLAAAVPALSPVTPKITAAPISAVSTPKLVISPKVVTPTTLTPAGSLKESSSEEKSSENPMSEKVIASPAATSAVNKATASGKKGGVFRYILLALAVALVISLIGGGVVISQQALTDKKDIALQTPVSKVTPTEAPIEPTATPKPTAAPVNLKELKVAVLNATSVAGKAGKYATLVKKAGATNVDAANAKGEYKEAGSFIMVTKPEYLGAIADLEKATELTLKEVEVNEKDNPNNKYDILIILNE